MLKTLKTTKELEIMSSIAAGTSRVELRQSLPLQSTAIVERCLGEGRFLVSDADSTVHLKLMQRELNDEFSRIHEAATVESSGEKIKVGELYLYRDSNLEVFRARILQVGTGVSCRLIDFGLCITAGRENFYSFSGVDFEYYYLLRPFVRRINLPTDEVLRDLNLPVASMIKEGDVVDMIVFTTTEPQLAVFNFARSDSYRFSPEKFTDGFDTQALKNWKSLFSYDSSSVEPKISRHGFGQLKNRDFHINRLALVAYVKALDKVYVHDLIRISFLRERLDTIYGNEKTRSQFAIHDLSELTTGVGCVAYHEKKGVYVRVEVIAVGLENLEVAPIDEPNLGVFSVMKEFIFKIPESLQFPRQCFAVRMTRHSDGQRRHYLSELARCVLPDKTPVILNSESTIGLVQIHCSNAQKGVLAKIGFVSLKESKFEAVGDGTKLKKKFGEKESEVVVADIEDVTRFANRTREKKKEFKLSISSKPSASSKSMSMSRSKPVGSESSVSFQPAESSKSTATSQSEEPIVLN